MVRIFLSLIFSASNVAYASLQTIYTSELSGYNSCFILYDIKLKKSVAQYESKRHYCQEKLSPDSTFKVPLSVIAFNEKLIHNQTIFKWDGKEKGLPDWNKDQTPKTWLQYSAVWVSQVLTPKMGLSKIKQYLKLFNYGNQDFTGDKGRNNGIQYAWLSSSLKISPIQQLHFLVKLYTYQFAIDKPAVDNTIQNMYLGKLNDNMMMYGKTGSGRHGNNERMKNPSHRRDGWFIGYIVSNDHHAYAFVSTLSDIAPISKQTMINTYGSVLLKPKIVKLLAYFFSSDNNIGAHHANN